MVRKDTLLGQADAIAVQETRLTSSGQVRNSKDLLHSGYHSLHGFPCSPVVFKNKGQFRLARSATSAGRQGGVAIFSKKPWPVLPCSRDSDIDSLYKKSRWIHAAIPLGNHGAASKRFLHVISFCNLSGRDQGLVHTNKNRYLEKVFGHASKLGQQPILICMDANTSVSGSQCLSCALATGRWVDLGAHFTNNNPQPTFCSDKKWDKLSWSKNVTRPDLIFANSAAVAICESFRIRRDLSPKGHLGLEVTINCQKICQTFQTFQPPRAFLCQSNAMLCASRRETIAQSLVTSYKTKFENARSQGPDVFQTFGRFPPILFRTKAVYW